ncbi:MAG: 3-isopropylmalate dehydratase small subunit [Myxococcales bacterium 13_1_40CM_2_68_15]|nr:MAG: 3-isopropylmalate dehydratase small subunit [Myxococcales bacterium 13_1_40CM_2_68_15]
MQPFRRLDSRIAVLARPDIDTDQIIPARYLKGTTRTGLGRWLFAGWRYDENGHPRTDFAFARPEARGAQVLVAGPNFGCGSSREHAPWALLDYGFRAVVSSSIADIFRANALKNGLLPVIVDAATHEVLLASPGMRVSIDLESCSLAFGDARVSFSIDPFARRCLLEGVDELGFLLAQDDAIAAYEKEDGCAR